MKVASELEQEGMVLDDEEDDAKDREPVQQLSHRIRPAAT